jgi:hypothetical protein
MPKNNRKKVCLCDRHDFSLRPKSEYTLQPQYLQVSFCKHMTEKATKAPRGQSPCLNCPTFNKDGNFATPTFILATEQVRFLLAKGAEEIEGLRMKEEH